MANDNGIWQVEDSNEKQLSPNPAALEQRAISAALRRAFAEFEVSDNDAAGAIAWMEWITGFAEYAGVAPVSVGVLHGVMDALQRYQVEGAPRQPQSYTMPDDADPGEQTAF